MFVPEESVEWKTLVEMWLEKNKWDMFWVERLFWILNLVHLVVL